MKEAEYTERYLTQTVVYIHDGKREERIPGSYAEICHWYYILKKGIAQKFV